MAEVGVACLCLERKQKHVSVQSYLLCWLQLQLEVELLKAEKQSADVSHGFYLSKCLSNSN